MGSVHFIYICYNGSVLPRLGVKSVAIEYFLWISLFAEGFPDVDFFFRVNLQFFLVFIYVMLLNWWKNSDSVFVSECDILFLLR